MKKYCVIFSGDFDFQVLSVIEGDLETGWNVANGMYEDGTFADNGIEHYDVNEFESLEEANDWIMEEVSEGRSKIQKEKTKQRAND